MSTLSKSLEEIEFLFPGMHVTRSSIGKGDLVPLHTHSNHYGFVYVLEGRCKIENYSIVKKQGSTYRLKLQDDKEYTSHQFTVISKQNNVHSILALEDTTFIDVFSVKPSDGMIQEFLHIVEKNEKENEVLARVITLQEANIAQHLLDKVCTKVEISD